MMRSPGRLASEKAICGPLVFLASARKFLIPLAGSIALVGASSSASARAETKSKLVSCGDDTCLQISGSRDDAQTVVTLNGVEVSVIGGRHWRVRVPLVTVESISPPNARTIEVTLRDTNSGRETTSQAVLPIGLLGNVTTLASLTVRAH